MKIKSGYLSDITRDVMGTLQREKVEYDIVEVKECRDSLIESLERMKKNLSLIEKEIRAFETDIKEIESTDEKRYVVCCHSKMDGGFQYSYFKTYNKARSFEKDASLTFSSFSDLKTRKPLTK